jgi:hypothetical protein
MKPKTFQELMEAVMEILPDAQLDEDLSGQIVIYTGLTEKDEEGNLEKFSSEEER